MPGGGWERLRRAARVQHCALAARGVASRAGAQAGFVLEFAVAVLGLEERARWAA